MLHSGQDANNAINSRPEIKLEIHESPAEVREAKAIFIFPFQLKVFDCVVKDFDHCEMFWVTLLHLYHIK